jgi:hypothetical protein
VTVAVQVRKEIVLRELLEESSSEELMVDDVLLKLAGW